MDRNNLHIPNIQYNDLEDWYRKTILYLWASYFNRTCLYTKGDARNQRQDQATNITRIR